MPATVSLSVAISAAVHAGIVPRVPAFVGVGSVVCAVNGVVSPHLDVPGDYRSHTQFDLVQQTIEFVSANVPVSRGRPAFWLEPGPKGAYLGSLVSTHLFLYSMAGSTYPRLPDDIATYPRQGATVTSGSSVVIVSNGQPDRSAVVREFARAGFDVRIGSTRRIEADPVAFFLTVVDVLAPVRAQ
jgi:hypothetical protein